jgi:hypothetical protein
MLVHCSAHSLIQSTVECLNIGMPFDFITHERFKAMATGKSRLVAAMIRTSVAMARLPPLVSSFRCRRVALRYFAFTHRRKGRAGVQRRKNRPHREVIG